MTSLDTGETGETGQIVTVTSEEELRRIAGEATDVVLRKDIGHLDEHARDFIAASPFVLLATSAPDGTCDVSPRGEEPGGVLVLDDHTLVIPDRPGNRRVDSLRNIVANPNVGLLFVVPGTEETLRVNGRAQVVSQAPYMERLRVKGRLPTLAVSVEVRECFFHCSKAFRRSALWQPERWPERESLPTLGRILKDQLNLEWSAKLIDDDLRADARENLY
ncbi:pyridoxamine 5'-phosphate oxidase family protein [Streptosporangium sp. NPDC000095]|uniref:pyridoxamine 5'-phosphate oxidase family protein n=1 Tax=Streptosporangium sp. NPDC000095 TaxID=3366184 RepID=UPI0036C11217